jgi:hypothetical protein
MKNLIKKWEDKYNLSKKELIKSMKDFLRDPWEVRFYIIIKNFIRLKENKAVLDFLKSEENETKMQSL